MSEHSSLTERKKHHSSLSSYNLQKKVIVEKLPDPITVQSFEEKLQTIKENNKQITEALAVFDSEIEDFTQLQNDVLELLKQRLLKLKG